MPLTKLNIDDFLKILAIVPVLDVRSPSEFSHANIPGAYSFPLFTDEERKVIGTAYKQESREKAVKIGLDFFGKTMVQMVEAAEKIVADRKSNSREVAVHCWRGGMRSAAVAWLLDLYGFKVYLLAGGYKAYRKWVLNQFEKNYPLLVVSGYTGSNKTGALMALKNGGEKVIDLEALAGHKGSAFGNLEMKPQPGQEQFENLLARELSDLSEADSSTPIWIEGESQRLGNVNIPQPFFKTLREQPVLFLDIPFDKRVACIVDGYGRYEKEKLIEAILRISKRLGGLETKNAIDALEAGDVSGCFSILLKYYDKLYLKSTLSSAAGARNITYIYSETTDPKYNSEKLLAHVPAR
jgi:tRNA 2-selenouridine synthase